MANYKTQIETMRSQRNQKTVEDNLHWLSLAGLFWLEEGENSIGSSADNKISLPSFPASTCGSFRLENASVTFHPAKGVSFLSKHPNPTQRPLITDLDKDPDLISFGPITMKIIVRGTAILVRAWDGESSAKKDFTGFKYYPVKEEYIVKAKFVHYSPPKEVKRFDMIGTETQGFYLGQAKFTLNGIECTLEAEKDGNELLFHFTDGTSKVTTYGGGRKFRIPQTNQDEVTLDFNLTENWPCAYTPFATCPVVPSENKLAIMIEAGEKNYFEDH
ncbi:MAG: DUF1684 domain-containing protein [Anaerolineales bacterium]